jgi:hypothetical protein
MIKQIIPDEPIGVPFPLRDPEIDPDKIPEDPVLPEEEPDIIPQEEPLEPAPYEVPAPGEGP